MNTTYLIVYDFLLFEGICVHFGYLTVEVTNGSLASLKSCKKNMTPQFNIMNIHLYELYRYNVFSIWQKLIIHFSSSKERFDSGHFSRYLFKYIHVIYRISGNFRDDLILTFFTMSLKSQNAMY